MLQVPVAAAAGEAAQTAGLVVQAAVVVGQATSYVAYIVALPGLGRILPAAVDQIQQVCLRGLLQEGGRP